MITVTDTSILDKYDRKRKDDYQAEIQKDVEQTEPTTQATPATEQKPKTRADIVQDLGINPQRDTKRMRSLQQAGKVQAYTNALSLLAQAAGGFAGATVPKIDWKNSAGEELSNLQKMYDEEDSWSRRQMLLDKIQDLNRKDQQGFETELMKERFGHDENMFTKRTVHDKNMVKVRETSQKELDRTRTDQNIRQIEETQAVADDTKNGRTGQRNKLTGEFKFDKEPTTTTGGTGGTGSGQGTPFFEIYDRGSNKPVTTVQTKDQAIGLVRDIIDSNKNNPEFEDEILRIIGDKSLSEVSDEGLKFIINKYWKDGQSHIDSPANHYLQYKQQVDDYLLTKFNQEDRKNLNVFLSQNRNASEEDIIKYLKQYDINIPNWAAYGIASKEAAKVKETQQVMQQNYENKVLNILQNPQEMSLLDQADKAAAQRYQKGTEKYYQAIRTYLRSRGFSLEEANQFINDNQDL